MLVRQILADQRHFPPLVRRTDAHTGVVAPEGGLRAALRPRVAGVVGIAVIGIGRKAENHVRADIALIGRTETAGHVGRARLNRALDILLYHQALPRFEDVAAYRTRSLLSSIHYFAFLLP